MATAQQLWDDAQTKVAAQKAADAQVDDDKTKLAADTALAQTASSDVVASQAKIQDKFPEGQAFVFGAVSVSKLHGAIVILPVLDPSTDLGD